MSPRPPDGAARFISKPGLGLRQPVITTDLERIAHQKEGPDTLTGEAGIGWSSSRSSRPQEPRSVVATRSDGYM